MLLIFASFLLLSRDASACTTFAVGRKATTDGSVIIGQSEDGDDLADVRVIHVPAADHPEGAQRPVVYADGPFPRWVSDDLGKDYKPNKFTGHKVTEPIGYIPQVRHTYAYQDSNYAIINEHNVAIDESTCSAMFKTCGKGDTRGCGPGQTGKALLDSRMLSMLALERSTTARQAVQIIGDLSYEFGFYGTHDPNGDGEALLIADAQEAWVLNILADPTGTKSIWAAVRVPDDHMTVLSNMFTLREIDVKDTANCLASPNVYSVAREHGWLQPGEVLDFTRVYSNGEYGKKYYAGRRMWRGLTMAAPSSQLSPEYSDLRYDRHWPWSVKPDNLVTPHTVMSWYRDYYAGTKFDMTKGLAAGYGGTPDRFDTSAAVDGAWERSIALYRTNLVKIQQLRETSPDRPRGAAGVAWLAAGPAHYTPFLPVPSGFDRSLKPLIAGGDPHHYHKSSLNWAARKVMTVCQVRFDYMHRLVEKLQHELEASGQALVDSATIELAKGGDIKSFADRFEAHGASALESWRDLSEELLFRFSDNSNIRHLSVSPVGEFGLSENIASLDYPADWLRAVGFPQGPPNPPVETQCPPKCPSTGSPTQLSSLNTVDDATFGFVAACACFGVAALTGLGALLIKTPRRSQNLDEEGSMGSQYGRI